jgi:cell wall-associated NlpC family hydrolase
MKSMSQRITLLVLLAALSLFGAGCAKKTPHAPVIPPKQYADKAGLADFRNLPQNLTAYLEKGDANAPLLSPDKAQMRVLAFLEKQFEPWDRKQPAYSLKSVAEAYTTYKKSPGWDENNLPRDPDWAADLERLSNLRAFPSMAKKAITVRNSNLRSLPTRGARFADPTKPGEGYPFDYLQHSAVSIATPLFVTHFTTDRKWLLAESAFTYGWLPAEDVAFVDEAFMQAFRTGGYVAVTRDNTPLPGEKGLTADIGAVLPALGIRDGGYDVLLAGRDENGMAVKRPSCLPRQAAALLPLALTPANVAALGNQMMGQVYGWGGLDDKRDCSSLTRDLFIPFGSWLPRNSTAQAKSYPTMSLEGLTPKEKEEAILRRGVPFATLLWMKGHIMLYIGERDGKPLIFHNAWGLRTLEPDGSTGRLIIGKAAVTTTSAGLELPKVGPERIWINRILAMTFLAGPN